MQRPILKITAILPAAGSGRRFGAESNKLFANLAGRPLWTHAVDRLSEHTQVEKIIVAVSPEDRDRFDQQLHLLQHPGRVEFATGGKERSDTVSSAIKSIAVSDENASSHLVAIHDAARPLVNHDDLTAVFAKAAETGAAILANPVTGTLKRQKHVTRGKETGCETVDREGMWVAQTPQVFRLDWIRQAYANHRGRAATDDAQLVERLGHSVAIATGAADNLKITYPEDLLVAEARLAASSKAASLETENGEKENGEHDASRTD